ncbi:hypothetical protein HRbin05_00470 [archaeon HR05]|nr:hypothetical protein HRbin05_00470 [archaeon HR05]
MGMVPSALLQHLKTVPEIILTYLQHDNHPHIAVQLVAPYTIIMLGAMLDTISTDAVITAIAILDAIGFIIKKVKQE